MLVPGVMQHAGWRGVWNQNPLVLLCAMKTTKDKGKRAHEGNSINASQTGRNGKEAPSIQERGMQQKSTRVRACKCMSMWRGRRVSQGSGAGASYMLNSG
jgi:hypothetical protein